MGEISGEDFGHDSRLCGFEVVDIYRGYNGDKEDLDDPSSASRYQSNLIWILKRKEM